MATQRGIYLFRGTLFGATADKNGVLRPARESSKEQFESSPTMARTRENAKEFTQAAASGKLLREAFRKQIQGAGVKRNVTRVMRLIRQVIAQDTSHPRGQRQVMKANASLLEGFDFNDSAPLSGLFFADYGVAVSGAGVVTVAIPSLIPMQDMAPPADATHYQLELGVAVLDFETGTQRVAAVTGVPAPDALDLTPVLDLELTADLGGAPGATEIVLVALGVNFFQQTNGQLYPLHSGGVNPLRVIHAE